LKISRCYTYSRLRLDDALNQLESNEDPMKAFEGWSEARIKAYKMIDANPNTYYYRFNAPGEKQRNGAWTPVCIFYFLIFYFYNLKLY